MKPQSKVYIEKMGVVVTPLHVVSEYQTLCPKFKYMRHCHNLDAGENNFLHGT